MVFISVVDLDPVGSGTFVRSDPDQGLTFLTRKSVYFFKFFFKWFNSSLITYINFLRNSIMVHLKLANYLVGSVYGVKSRSGTFRKE
jgi:hypothetical protein